MVSMGRKDFKYFICYEDAKQIRPLCIFLPRMSTYRRDFDETKSISLNYLSVLMMNCQENTIKLGKKSATLLKKNLTVNLCTMKNI